MVDRFRRRVGPAVDGLGLVDRLGEPGHVEVDQGLVVVPWHKAEQVRSEALHSLVDVGVGSSFSGTVVVCKMVRGEPVAVSRDYGGAVADVAHHRAQGQLDQGGDVASAGHLVVPTPHFVGASRS